MAALEEEEDGLGGAGLGRGVVWIGGEVGTELGEGGVDDGEVGVGVGGREWAAEGRHEMGLRVGGGGCRLQKEEDEQVEKVG